MKILNMEIDFDFADADDLEKFEKAYPKTMEELEKIETTASKGNLTNSEQIRNFCNIIFDFFDEVFEKGISEKLFKGKANYMECMRAFKSVVIEKEKQDTEMEEIASYVSQYSPDRVKRS